MPTAIKIGSQHLLISLFIAPLSILAFTALGGEVLDSHDNSIKMDYLVETVSETQTDIRDIKNDIYTNRPRVHKNSLDIEWLKRNLEESIK